MTVSEIMNQKNLSKYRLAKESGIPYTTVSDICSGKAQLEKCAADTVYRLAQTLGVTMESLLKPFIHSRIDFELYKSNVCHKVKELGDIDFIIDILDSDEIREYYSRRWYPESLYLLAMVDYLSRINNIPLCEDYDDIRRCRLKETVYPSGVLSMVSASESENLKQRVRSEAIPEFMRFNIVENEVRNVI